MTGAVLTETDHTGRKLKTFVPANGATVAEQEMVRIGGTTTEKLTFIHQDPSLAGAFGGAVDVGGGFDGFGTHTHVMFSSNGRKIDPRSVFCADISRQWWSPALRNGRFELIYR